MKKKEKNSRQYFKCFSNLFLNNLLSAEFCTEWQRSVTLIAPITTVTAANDNFIFF